jgi:DNA invertase Pin-like site-specific DNA recombinase
MAKEIAGGAVPDPAGYAACIWNDPTSTKAERMQAWKDAAPYMWPRLARSTLDPLHTVDAIAKAGAGFRSLADTWADSTTPHGKLMLTVLGGLAEFERSLIITRTQAGIARAKERGVTFGRPTKLSPKQRCMIAERYAAGETAVVLAREFDVGEATIWRALAAA